MCQKGWDNYRRLALIYDVDIFAILHDEIRFRTGRKDNQGMDKDNCPAMEM